MNSRTTPFATLLLVIACSVFGGGALAQTITGRISGTVTDSNGAAVPGVTVKIINEATQQVRNATADPNGFYVATNLPVGNYSVTVEHQGFKKATKTRSEEHTSELQSLRHLVCRLLLEKKKQ